MFIMFIEQYVLRRLTQDFMFCISELFGINKEYSFSINDYSLIMKG